MIEAHIYDVIENIDSVKSVQKQMLKTFNVNEESFKEKLLGIIQERCPEEFATEGCQKYFNLPPKYFEKDPIPNQPPKYSLNNPNKPPKYPKFGNKSVLNMFNAGGDDSNEAKLPTYKQAMAERNTKPNHNFLKKLLGRV